MPKRKLLSQMSERHYRRLKCKARNMANMDKQSIDFNETSDVLQDFSNCNVMGNTITNINHDLDEATNIVLRNESSQNSNSPDIHNENAYDFDHNINLERSLYPITYICNNKKSDDYTSSSDALSIKDDLIKWATQFQIPHVAITELLQILRKFDFNCYLPKNSKTLLKTPRYTNIRKVAPGEYFHNSLKSEIINFLQKSQDDVDSVQVQISIDGLPISNSSSNQLWPILGSIAPSLHTIFIIGCYFGPTKPHDCNEFLRDFVDEAKSLVTDGLEYGGKHISVSIHSLIADAPAKSFVTATKGHTGYFSCSKCTTEGEYIDRRMCFPDINCCKRTNESFFIQRQTEHHPR